MKATLLSMAALLAQLAARAGASSRLRLEAKEESATILNGEVLSHLQLFSEYAAATSCNAQNNVGQILACPNDDCIQMKTNQATTQATFEGNTTGVEGLLAVDDKARAIVLAFRGSQSIRNYMSDFDIIPKGCADLAVNCDVHGGFAKAWSEVANDVLPAVARASAHRPEYAIVATGHSLGAAVATLAAAYLRKSGLPVDLYTYGSPRVGNDVLADFITAQPGREWRVTHVDDVVPRLPPLFLGYRHTSPEVWLATGNASTVEYTLREIQVCIGNANKTCNAGTSGLDYQAHMVYFRDMAICQGLTWKRDLETSKVTPDVTDETLAKRLDMVAQLDGQYAASLESSQTVFSRIKHACNE